MDEDSTTLGRLPDPGRRGSLRDVFDASYRRLVVQLYGVTVDVDEAEEVVQEAFVRAAASGRRFLRVDDPEAWLRTTALHVHRSRWRRARSGECARHRMFSPHDPTALEEHVDVISALHALPEEEREVVALHYLADLPVDRVADELGVPPGTVRSRLAHGRAALTVLITPANRGAVRA
jgi:RNA polymerase sigma-70 factor, ECF subfamily